MAPSSEIWLGDLVRAVSSIPGDADLPQRIAALLGLTQAPADAEEILPDGYEPGAVTEGADESAAGECLPPDESYAGWQSHDDVPMLSKTSQAAAAMTDWESAPSLPRMTDELLAARPEMAPLLAPRSAAAVLDALLATTAADGPLDVPALTQACARGVPVSRIPRLPRRTLRFGVQVLVDVGEAMELFVHDQADLVDRITALVGAENTEVLYFADCPLRGAGAGPRRTWRAYRPPSRGSRVLVVSDFGVGGPAFHVRRSRTTEWQEHSVMVSRAGAVGVGLLPYPPHRWPAWLTALMPLAMWDRATTAGIAAATLAGR